ncbi:MAG: VOC family protein [Rhodospirillales bacterium]|nr:VOC family protein [Rhodospirillales bacterium]
MSSLVIQRLDHLVLTVADVEATAAFYGRVFGFRRVDSDDGRIALAFGAQKINLHLVGTAVQPRAAHPQPGSADLCFVTTEPIERVLVHLDTCGIDPVEGPVRRLGALGAMTSIYIRDPDGNLAEIAVYD